MAVGVVDVLPRCLSSVYLFWDSDFAHLAPGKLSALKEIEWVQQVCRQGVGQRQGVGCLHLHERCQSAYLFCVPEDAVAGTSDLVVGLFAW